MIRTGIPFGYLFIGLFLLAAFVAGVIIFIHGGRGRFPRARWAGAALCALVVIVVMANSAFESALEWNPTMSDTDVVGRWVDRAQTLTLGADKTFTYRTPEQTSSGTWRRDDWNLYLDGESNSGTMRFVEFRGHLRLLTRPPNDPDTWDGDLGLKRSQPQ